MIFWLTEIQEEREWYRTVPFTADGILSGRRVGEGFRFFTQ